PVAVEIGARSTPIGAVAGQSSLDPGQVPTEAILESEPYDWWTAGRGVRIGRAVAIAAQQAGSPIEPQSILLLDDLPVPYDHLNGNGFDGRKLWREKVTLTLSG